MEIKLFYNKDNTSNTYLVKTKENYYIIDPGSTNMEELIDYLNNNNIDLSAIILTHGHFDHINGIPDILKYKNVPIYIYEEEKEFLYNPRLSLLFWGDLDQNILDESLKNANIITLKEGDIIDAFEIIHTPGHTKGSICLYNKDENILISGDTMFKGSFGRTDLPTGNSRDMRDSFRKLFTLEHNTDVYPGHGDKTTILDEYRAYYSSY